MKKFLGVLLLTGAVIAASAQTTVPTEDLSKWSVEVKAGLDFYRVNPPGSGLLNRIGWTPGISLDYTMNPLLGFGADLSYITFNRNVGSGSTVDFTIYESTNFSNLLSPVRAGFWEKVNVYGNLGGGLSFWQYDLNSGANNNGVGPVIYIGLQAEYALNSSWGLGVEGQYRYYTYEGMGGAPVDGLGVDGALATVNLRYKIGAKNKTHVRNMKMDEFYPSPVKQVATMLKDENAEIMRQVNAIRDENKAIRQRLDNLEKDMVQVKEQTAKNSLLAEQYAAGTTIDVDFPEVLFKLQSSKLTQEAQSALDQVSSVLKQKVFSKVVVSGHADTTGPAEFNMKIGMDRANAVKEALTAKGISASKIEAVSYGEEKPRHSNNTLEGRQRNRRVEIEVKR
jgi:outer membrane protein OmpA-like peptidoglycan-associated protein